MCYFTNCELYSVVSLPIFSICVACLPMLECLNFCFLCFRNDDNAMKADIYSSVIQQLIARELSPFHQKEVRPPVQRMNQRSQLSLSDTSAVLFQLANSRFSSMFVQWLPIDRYMRYNVGMWCNARCIVKSSAMGQGWGGGGGRHWNSILTFFPESRGHLNSSEVSDLE